MNPLTLAGLKTLAANKSARWIGGLALAGACLFVARCQGAISARADDRIHLDDSVAKVSAANVKSFDALRVSDSATLAGLAASLEKARDTTQRAIARADSMYARLSVVKPVGTITILHSDSAAMSSSAAMNSASGDTVQFAAIQRQGDARAYSIPQFVVDVGAELRKALTAAQSTIAQQQAVIDQANRTISDDARARIARDAEIAARTDAEKTAKSNDGRECRILFWGCPPRVVVGGSALIAGGIAGALLDHQLATKK
jgi:hypothetical protein